MRLAGRIGDADAHRYSLHHLDPIAAGIFGRQQRKARRRRRADAVDGAAPLLARIAVDLDRRLLSGLDVGQFGFLWAGLNPDVIGRDDVERGCGGGKVLARLKRRHVGHNAGKRRAHHRVRQLARCLVARGNRILVFGMVFDGCIRVAIQVGGKPCELLLQRGKLLLRALQGIAGGIVGSLWSKIVGNQLLLALKVDHVEVDIFLRLFDLGLHVAVAGLERNEVVARISDLSLGAIQRQLKLQRIQLEQDVALGDLLIVVNQYLA